MNKILKSAMILLIITLTFTGCRTAAIQNVPEQSVVTYDKNKAITNDDVLKAIAEAGAELGWMVRKVSDGVAIATLNVRTHTAVVTINYSTDKYSISYKNSSNLKYNNEKQTIHQQYNNWIRNLNNKIKLKMNFL